MAAHASVVTPWRSGGLFLALVPLALFTVACATCWGWDRGVFVAAVSYLCFRLVLVRGVVCRDHRTGVSLTRRGKFEDAIAAFRRSEVFWDRHRTLDRLRGPVLGSATSHSFYVFAIYNQAYCEARLGRGDEARILLDRVLSTHPDMLPARELRDVLAAGRGAAAP